MNASPAPSSAAPSLSDPEKLQLVVGNCMQKALELILHARLKPLPPALKLGAVNRWVRPRTNRLHPPTARSTAPTRALRLAARTLTACMYVTCAVQH